MKTEQFISDLSKLRPEDFNYMHAYTDRETGKFKPLFGKPLGEVFKTSRVCISGYFLSMLGAKDTTGISLHYDMSNEQLGAIIHPECTVVFDTHTNDMESPKRDAGLDEVKGYIESLFLMDDFINNEFYVEETIEY